MARTHRYWLSLLAVIFRAIVAWITGNNERLKLRIYYQIDPNQEPTEYSGERMILTVDQKVKLTIAPVDKYGNPAPVEGIVWISSDPTIMTVEVSPDGLSAAAVTAGKIGTAQVSVVADAKIGEEVKEITGVIDFDVKGGEAVTLSVMAGAPEAK